MERTDDTVTYWTIYTALSYMLTSGEHKMYEEEQLRKDRKLFEIIINLINNK